MLRLYPTFASDGIGWERRTSCLACRTSAKPEAVRDATWCTAARLSCFPDLPTDSTKLRGGSGASVANRRWEGPVEGSAHGAGIVEPAHDSRQEPDPDLWFQRLVSAFEHLQPADGYLPLAEAALKACPGDPDLLLLAANAALIDGNHPRAFVFLKRFHKRASSTR